MLRRSSCALLLLASCAGGLEDPDSFEPPRCVVRNLKVQQDILQKRCGTGGCHAAGDNPAAGLDLVSADLVSRLSKQETTCGMVPLIDTSSPADSFLLKKLREAPPCGERMPPIGASLTPAEIGCVLGWIENETQKLQNSQGLMSQEGN